jgi:hypothetical protein
MLKTLIAFNQGNIFEEVAHQELWDPDEKYCLFSVSNLWECPEDAIIGRDLFDSYDAEILIEHGMKWAREGYDELYIKYVACPRGEDLEEFIENYLNEWKPVQEGQEKE